MKTFVLLSAMALVSCKTAYISDYSYPDIPNGRDCYYEISLEENSFVQLTPMMASTSNSVLIDDQWTTVNDDEFVGYALDRDEYASFIYLLEDALNPSNVTNSCGRIYVNRIQHQAKVDYTPILSLVTLFIPNVLGMPVISRKVKNTYLFQVYDNDGQLLYRGTHAGEGKATCGFYYGYKNADEKADYDATYVAIAAFVKDFR
ncbi:MAG: hypothetical protein KBA14_07645 [Saprospiraceae bacterium]|nr:hypothetical protein [Saprospiraceae bacterium]